MSDLSLTSTADLVAELWNRSDTFVLWHRQDGNDLGQCALRGDVAEIGVVSASIADVYRDLDLLSEDEAAEVDMSELLRARLTERLDD